MAQRRFQPGLSSPAEKQSLKSPCQKWEAMNQLSLLLGQPPAFEKQDFERIWLGHHNHDRDDTVSRNKDSFLGLYDVAEGDFPDAILNENLTADMMSNMVSTIDGPGPFRSAAFVERFRSRFVSEKSHKVFHLLLRIMFTRVVYPDSNKYELKSVREQLATALVLLNTVKSDPSLAKYFPFFLAEATVSCFHTVFPGSVQDFDDKWTIKLYQDLSEEVLGFRWHALTVCDFRKKFFAKSSKKFTNTPHAKSLPMLFTTNSLSPSLQLHANKEQLQLPGNPAVPIHFKNPFTKGEQPSHASTATAPPSSQGSEADKKSKQDVEEVHSLDEKDGDVTIKKGRDVTQIDWAPGTDDNYPLSEARGIFSSSAQLLHDHAGLFPGLNARSVMGEMLERKARKRERERLPKSLALPRKHDLKS